MSKARTVRPGPPKPERVLICCVYQDPVGFNVAVARRVPRSDEWMISVVRWKQGALSQKPDHLSHLIQGLPSFPHPFDIPGKLIGL